MPYSDPEKQREYQRRRLRAKKADPVVREALTESRRAYMAKNRDALREYNRKCRQENKDLVNAAKRERYRRLGGRAYRRHLADLMEDHAGMCGICGEDMFGLESDSDIHVDHIVPRVGGGTDDYENLQPVHAVCNLRKKDKMRG